MNARQRELIELYAPIDREYRVVMKPGAVIVSRFSTREAAERYAADLNRRLEGDYCTVKP